MGIRIATDYTWRHVDFGQQDLSKTRLNLMQLHRPMMLKLVMVGRRFRRNEETHLVCAITSAVFYY